MKTTPPQSQALWTNDTGLFIDVTAQSVPGLTGRGAAVTLLSRVAIVLLSLASQAVLARWLAPAEYGLYAISLVVLSFLLVFRDLGLQNAGLYKSQLYRREATFLFWSNLVVVSIICGVAYVSAPAIALVFGDARQVVLLQWMCVAAVVGGISAQHSMLLRRRMAFSKVAVAEFLSLAVGSCCSIAYAYRSPDALALVVLYVVQQCVLSLAIFFFVPWLPGRPERIVGGASLIQFGAATAIANLIYFVTNNLSTVLIGLRLDSSTLGQFNRSQQLYQIPTNVFAASIYTVAFGALSRLRSEPRLYKEFYVSALAQVSALFFTLAGYLMFAGDDVVRVLLGEQWDAAGDLLRVMSFGLIGVGAAQMTGILYQTQGRLNQFQLWGLADGLIRISAILIGSRYGVFGIAAGFAVATTLITAPLAMLFVGRRGPVSFADQMREITFSSVCFLLSASGAALGKHVAGDVLPSIRLLIEGFGSVLLISVVVLSVPGLRRHFMARATIFRTVVDSRHLGR